MEIQNKRFTREEFGKIVDKISWGFAFVCAGGYARALPIHCAQMFSMFLYTKYADKKHDKHEMALAGSIGATFSALTLLFTFPSFLGELRKLPFLLGIFGSYYATGLLYGKIMDLYFESNYDSEISTMLFNSYKWSYISIFLLSYLARIR